jgi:intraflagellar transport protein 56
MLLSRLRQGRRNKKSAAEELKEKSNELKKLDNFLQKRDYMGAISLLEHERKSATENDQQMNLSIWLAYCYFHAADYRKSCTCYEQLIGNKQCPPEIHLYMGCAYFFLAMYENARKAAEKGYIQYKYLSL